MDTLKVDSSFTSQSVVSVLIPFHSLIAKPSEVLQEDLELSDRTYTIPARSKRSFDTALVPGPIGWRANRTILPLTSSLRLEHSILKKQKPLKATVLAQDIPSWLLGIKSMDWELINCLAHARIPRPEVQASINNLSPKCRFFPDRDALLKNSHLTDIALISGTPPFLRAVLPLLPASLPLLIHCKRHSYRQRPSPQYVQMDSC